jgi:apolipoprotein N-acyltransferase
VTGFARYTLPVALLTGLLLYVGLPGGGSVWPLLFVGLVPFLCRMLQVSGKQAFFGGLFTGLVHFLFLLYWIIIVLGRYGGLPWVVALQALLLLALYMSSYFVIFTMLARVLLIRGPWLVGLLVVPALWVGLDWLRSVLFTGFPWMDLGYGLFQVPLLVQLADLVGHGGLTYLILLVNVAVLLVIQPKNTVLQRLMVVAVTALMVAGVVGYGQNRLRHFGDLAESGQGGQVVVAIAQGNIDQAQKWSPDNQQLTLDIYRRLTRTQLLDQKPSMVVWPETALPFYPNNKALMAQVYQLVIDNGIVLLTGAPWYEIIDREARKAQLFNSSLLLGPDGRVQGQYFKSHLVPFGEYVPLKRFLPFLAPLVEAVGDFSPGTIGKPLVSGKMQLGVLICFESVFPDLARAWIENGANILVNLTNDAWYGKSSAPHQSLAMAVLRAVETRRSLIRSANTGISAFVAPDGKILAESGLFTEWAATARLTLMQETSWFVRGGYRFGPGCLGVGVAVSTLIAARGRRKRSTFGAIH